MQTVTVSWLQSVEALKDVPGDQLQWLIDHSHHYEMEEGDLLNTPGQILAGTHFIITGRAKLTMLLGNEIRELGMLEPGSISGYLPFSRAKAVGVTSRAVEKSQVMTFPRDRVQEMISKHYELTQALVHIMTNRVREFTSKQQQDEKMMALGKLSAGLAHELNNPAAAIVRGSNSLKQHLQLEPTTFKAIMAIKMDEQQIDIVCNQLFSILRRKDRPKLTLMQRTEKEDAIRDWLDDHSIDNSDELAENFAEYAFSCDDLESFEQHIPAKYLNPIFNWINTNLVTERMVEDIEESSQRISLLVRSVKNFTHMDQGKGKDYTDIHEGIRNTLVILNHKIKKAGIVISEDFDASLPKVRAMVGELNQVWTNLIDNAIDAMEGVTGAQLIIKTKRDNEFVEVRIIDNGPGIPEDIRSRIFDPFFTTKSIGKGTGLGLDVVNRIIQQHRGSVKVNSRPGQTEFIVCFLIEG